jgi:hypothetical protein
LYCYCSSTLTADTADRTAISQALALFGEAVGQLSHSTTQLQVGARIAPTKPVCNCKIRRVANQLCPDRTFKKGVAQAPRFLRYSLRSNKAQATAFGIFNNKFLLFSLYIKTTLCQKQNQKKITI